MMMSPLSALQLSANDETKAFSTLSGFPTLSAAAGMRSKHGDLFSYVLSSRAAVPHDAPRFVVARRGPGRPGGLPRVTAALNRLGVKKAKPQRRPSPSPEPLPPAPSTPSRWRLRSCSHHHLQMRATC